MATWLRYPRPAELAGHDWRRTFHDRGRNHVYPAARCLDTEPAPTIQAEGIAAVGHSYWIELDDTPPLRRR